MRYPDGYIQLKDRSKDFVALSCANPLGQLCTFFVNPPSNDGDSHQFQLEIANYICPQNAADSGRTSLFLAERTSPPWRSRALWWNMKRLPKWQLWPGAFFPGIRLKICYLSPHLQPWHFKGLQNHTFFDFGWTSTTILNNTGTRDFRLAISMVFQARWEVGRNACGLDCLQKWYDTHRWGRNKLMTLFWV